MKANRSTIISFAILCSLALFGCKEEKRIPVEDSAWKQIDVKFPPPICEGTPWPLPKLPVAIESRPERPDVGFAPQGAINLAKGKKVSSSADHPIIGDLGFINDGQKMAGEGYKLELIDGHQWVTIDLESTSSIYVIWLWHQAGRDNEVFHDVVIEISNDSTFTDNVIQVFNNDYDNSLGLGLGKNSPYIESNYGKMIQLAGVEGRFIRFHSNGNGRNLMNHYVEIEIYGFPNSLEAKP